VSLVARELNAKKLELLHELLPTAARIGVLLNPSNPSIETFTSEVTEAASSLKQRIVVLKISTDYDLDAALAKLVEQHVGGFVVTDDPFFTNHRDRLAALAARHRIPAIYPWREYVEVGGLVSYGPALPMPFARSASMWVASSRGRSPPISQSFCQASLNS